MTNVTASASGGTRQLRRVQRLLLADDDDVTASASGGTGNSYGVYNTNSSPTMTDVTASASGGTDSYGVYNNSSSPTMTNVTASASGGTIHNYGVYNNASSPTMTDVTASASGGSYNYGVFNYQSSPTMTDVTASGSGAASSVTFGQHDDVSHGVYRPDDFLADDDERHRQRFGRIRRQLRRVQLRPGGSLHRAGEQLADQRRHQHHHATIPNSPRASAPRC